MHSHQRDGWVGGDLLGWAGGDAGRSGRPQSGGGRGGALSVEGRDEQGRGSALRGRGPAGAGP